MKKVITISLITLIITIVNGVVLPKKTTAVTASDWQAGRIVDDSVFTDTNAMSVSDIQSFLNHLTPSCDTNGTQPAKEYGRSDLTHAQYAALKGWAAPPYICLRDYYEVPKYTPGNYIPANNFSGSVPANAVSAAQIIYDAAKNNNINPKVILVKIATESSGPLTSDTWPLQSQYTYAMGSHCPDSGPNGTANCDSNYAGFSMQVQSGVELLRWYLDNMKQSWWSYKKPYQTNSVLWSLSGSGCGASDVYIQSKATAALYTYTPYQPNQAALTDMYGRGDGCSQHGNRNFWVVWNNWFGNPIGPNRQWKIEAINATQDDAGTLPAKTNGSELFMVPGQKLFVTVKVRNTGQLSWQQADTRLGTFSPIDYPSPFADSSWLAKYRITNMEQSVVYPNESATFRFTITAPPALGYYVERYDLLTEGVEWFGDANLRLYINVTTAPSNTVQPDTSLPSGSTLTSSSVLLSSDKNSALHIQPDGTLLLTTNLRATWSSNTYNSGASRLTLQSDGNLVLYNSAGQPVWSSNTYNSGASRLTLQSDGNLVLYNSAGQPVWSSNTPFQDQTGLFSIRLASGRLIYPGQSLQTPNKLYSLTLQVDGNLVLLSAGKPIWASNTYGSASSYLVSQADGNIVLYDRNGRPIWSSRTYNNGPSSLVIQQDGNLVLYSDSTARSTWSTNTYGK